MTAQAIRAAAANFRNCLAGLWPLAERRGVSRALFEANVAGLTPDLRIMDLLDAQPEFTKSFWDYLDILVNEDRIQNGRRFSPSTAPPSTRSRRRMASIATSSPRSWGVNPTTARRSASAR
jgi:Membrane-bound lytic murein transglycosylase B